MVMVKRISEDYGTLVLIVEQNALQVLKISDRVYVMKVGKITDMDKPEKFSSKEELRKVYLSEVK
jgi:branched-chain amino acid transport system ATP-binding protein